MSKPYFVSKGKIAKVKCNLCQKLLTRQNLREHMKNVHKDSSGNLREFGQGSILSFCAKSRPARQPNEGGDQDKGAGGGAEEFLG